jgi:hypothetical protein
VWCGVPATAPIDSRCPSIHYRSLPSHEWMKQVAPQGHADSYHPTASIHRLAGDVDGRVDPACCSQLHVIYAAPPPAARAPCRRRRHPPPRLLPACVLPPPSSTSRPQLLTRAIHPCLLPMRTAPCPPLYEQRDGPHTLGTLTLRSRVSTMSDCKWARGASSWVSTVRAVAHPFIVVSTSLRIQPPYRLRTTTALTHQVRPPFL